MFPQPIPGHLAGWVPTWATPKHTLLLPVIPASTLQGQGSTRPGSPESQIPHVFLTPIRLQVTRLLLGNWASKQPPTVTVAEIEQGPWVSKCSCHPVGVNGTGWGRSRVTPEVEGLAHCKPNCPSPASDLLHRVPTAPAAPEFSSQAPNIATWAQFLRFHPKSQKTHDGPRTQPLMSFISLSKELNLSEPVFSSPEWGQYRHLLHRRREENMRILYSAQCRARH